MLLCSSEALYKLLCADSDRRRSCGFLEAVFGKLEPAVIFFRVIPVESPLRQTDLRRDEVFAQIAAAHDLCNLFLRECAGDDAFIFHLVIGCIAVEIADLRIHMSLLPWLNVQILQDGSRQVFPAHNISSTARCAAMLVAKFDPDSIIIDVSEQLFRDRERAAVHQILSDGLRTAASGQNNVIVQMLCQLQNVLCAGDFVCIQHPHEFVTIDLRHMIQPLGKLVYAINLSIRGKIYAAQIQAQIHDLACRAMDRDRFGHRFQGFQRCNYIFFFCRGRHREGEQYLFPGFALP